MEEARNNVNAWWVYNQSCKPSLILAEIFQDSYTYEVVSKQGTPIGELMTQSVSLLKREFEYLSVRQLNFVSNFKRD